MHEKSYHKKQKSQNNNCPQCGFHISYSHSFESILAGNFDNERDGSYTATRVTPLRAGTIEADVLVPAAQSLIWSVVVSLPAIPVAFWMRYEWYFPVAVGSVSMLVSWVSAMKRSDNSQAKVEEFQYTSNGELSEKHLDGPPPPGISLTVIDKTQKNNNSWKIVDLPKTVTQEKADEFLTGIALGKSVSRSEWTPERKHFTRDQYDEICASLLAGNIIIDIPGKGKRLTEVGKAALVGYVDTLGINRGIDQK